MKTCACAVKEAKALTQIGNHYKEFGLEIARIKFREALEVAEEVAVNAPRRLRASCLSSVTCSCGRYISR